MNVQYIDHMGSDLTVANAARVSFNKHKEVFEASDERLIYYLANHNHWTPFAHPQITLRMKAPVFIRTQCFKHKVGFVENEISRRYVDYEPEFYMPESWRGRPTNGAKQGSSDTEVTLINGSAGYTPTEWVEGAYSHALSCYNDLLDSGVAPEQARMVLPQSMYTEWYWTGSLSSYARFYRERTDPHAQKEISDLAEMVGDVIEPLFPVSWKLLTERKEDA